MSEALLSEVSQYLSSGPSAAFFDLDRTLISGSSAFVLGVAAWRAGLVPPRQFGKDAVGAVAFRYGGASDDTSTGVRDRILGAVKGVRVEDLVALNVDIVPKLIAKVRPEAQALVDRHRHAGRATYIVSASPVELVEPLAKALGMTAGIGTISEIADGVYTGDLAGPFCYGPGQGGGDRAIWRDGRTSTSASATPTATRPATCRCWKQSAIRSRSTPTQSWSGSPVTTVGRSWCSASERRPSCDARRKPSAQREWPRQASRPAPAMPAGDCSALARWRAELGCRDHRHPTYPWAA